MSEWYVFLLKETDPTNVVNACNDLGCDTFLPTLVSLRARSDNAGSRTIENLIFPGYIFISIDSERVSPIVVEKIPGIRELVHYRKNFAILSAVVINEMRQYLKFREDSTKLSDVELRHHHSEIAKLLTILKPMRNPDTKIATFIAYALERSLKHPA
jgi:transcription antitermination factor NusG